VASKGESIGGTGKAAVFCCGGGVCLVLVLTFLDTSLIF
jgi:hypothetical protein